MEIPKHYDPKKTEDKWYKYWLDNGFFKSVPDNREPYTIVIPPPNVTGVLHMGHMLNNTIQDVLIRRARMLGKNACWVPGTDHASIATEAKVVAKLKEKGIEKSDITREEFLKHAWEWTEKHGGLILEQLKKIGASCDWDRTRFTMEEDLSNAVIDVFIKLHNKGLIYRGVRMVNWDPDSKTAVSDEEVIHKEVNSKLYYIRYEIENTDKVTPSPTPPLKNPHQKMRGQERGISLPIGEGQGGAWITIATTRPETILGDTAVCMHPDDERYKNLKGKRVIIPLIGRSVPVIFDEYIDMDFGTGVLKVTPAHDINDYELGVKHKLESIDIFNDDGTLSEKAQLYVGEDRFVVREKITEQLSREGYLVKVEEIKNKVGYSERTDAVIEPKLSMQWFLKMSEMSKPALENVMNDSIKLIPAKFKNTYRHWMENVRDWCISRQLWWGHRIPAWYDEDGNYVVARTKEEAIKLFKVRTPAKGGSASGGNPELPTLKQDEDVLDTWFSSWLWPISVFDGFSQKGEKDIQYYYPTNDLVTAPDILFFWVARMIMAGYEFRGEKPFKNVYLTGMVRDKLHRKMSKSLGNSPEPLDLINKYGADGVRVGMLLCSPAGNDLLFDEGLCEQGRNFSNKIWNAFRLVKSWEVDENAKQPKSSEVAVDWFDAKLNKTIAVIDDHFSKYRISDALMDIYKLIWDDFCSWYLEMIKPPYKKPIDKITFDATVGFFESIIKLLHPFMPFISEEIWHLLSERGERDCIIVADWSKAKSLPEDIIIEFDMAAQVISTIRNIRKDHNIPNKEQLTLYIKTSLPGGQAGNIRRNNIFNEIIAKLGNLSEIKNIDTKVEGAVSFMVKADEFFIPLADQIDIKTETEKLVKELKYTEGFLNSVMRKLSNEKFIANANPKVIEIERMKQVDAEAKIKALEEQLKEFKK